jgi:tetratricopeptide (TPR) repeat protein
LHEAAAAICRELCNQEWLSAALSLLGLDLWLLDESRKAENVVAESLRVARAIGVQEVTAQSLRNLGMVARSLGEYERAAAFFGEAVSQAGNDWYARTRAICHLDRAVYLQHDCEAARRHFCAALGFMLESRLADHTLADCLDWLDWLAAVDRPLGRATRAATLFDAAEGQSRASGAIRYPPDRPAYERDVAAVRAKVDAETFTATWTAGLAMSSERAIIYALEGESENSSSSRLR